MSRPKAPSPTTTARLPAMITRCGRKRSANTPLSSEKTSIGAVWAAITYERSAVEPVTLSTAKETPTSENPMEKGPSSRSTSSSRKSRMASTGYRRAGARQDMKKSFANGGKAVELTLQRRKRAIYFRAYKQGAWLPFGRRLILSARPSDPEVALDPGQPPVDPRQRVAALKGRDA